MQIAIWPIIVLIVGLFLYLVPTTPPRAKLTEIGRIMFIIGLLWTVYRVMSKTFVLG